MRLTDSCIQLRQVVWGGGGGNVFEISVLLSQNSWTIMFTLKRASISCTYQHSSLVQSVIVSWESHDNHMTVTWPLTSLQNVRVCWEAAPHKLQRALTSSTVSYGKSQFHSQPPCLSSVMVLWHSVLPSCLQRLSECDCVCAWRLLAHSHPW